MKKALIIGSAVVDVTIRVDHLPGLEGDVNTRTQMMRLGGCACNVANMFRLLEVPYDLAAPVGTGVYGDLVRQELQKKHMHALFDTPEEDGCCYCIVDKDGNRTFLSVHGAEYRLHKEMLDTLNVSDYALAYCCGLEIEEETGENIIRFFETHPELPFCYAPGVRTELIPRKKHDRLLALHPMLHLNLREAQALLGETGDLRTCAEHLHERTGNTVVITDGREGSCVCDHDGYVFCSAEKLDAVLDSNGAGDAHCGTFLACILRGDSPEEALKQASSIGAKLCTVEGAMLETL